MMENTNAIVLRSVDFSETSLILTLYSKDFGKIEALAKGGRRLKGPFESALDILARIRVTFLTKRGDALDLLTESKLLKRFHVTQSNLAGLYAGYYVVELVHLLTDRGDPMPGLYDLTNETLDELETGHSVMRNLLRFEIRFLTLIGQQPSLRHCVECGNRIEAELFSRRRIPFGHLDGGVLCPRCVPGHQQVVSVSENALQALERLERADGKTTPLDRNVSGEIRGLLNNYFSHLIGKRPRLYDWLNFISKNDKDQVTGENR